MAIWVQIPDLPIEYFDKKFLFNVGNAIGKTLKVDLNTAGRDRGRFARISVEVDLDKPLLLKFQIEGLDMEIHYESMTLLCLSCGIFGHTRESCKAKKSNDDAGNKHIPQPPGQPSKKDEQGAATAAMGELQKESPWKVVQRSRRSRKSRPDTVEFEAKSRFAILEEEISETSEEQ